jgi:hypothetical protein
VTDYVSRGLAEGAATIEGRRCLFSSNVERHYTTAVSLSGLRKSASSPPYGDGGHLAGNVDWRGSAAEGSECHYERAMLGLLERTRAFGARNGCRRQPCGGARSQISAAWLEGDERRLDPRHPGVGRGCVIWKDAGRRTDFLVMQDTRLRQPRETGKRPRPVAVKHPVHESIAVSVLERARWSDSHSPHGVDR